MNKIFALSLAILFIHTACNKDDLSANLIANNSFDQQNTVVELANGLKMNINSDISQILQGDALKQNDYTLQSKLMVKNKDNNTIQFIDFPKLELAPTKNTDIFEISETLIYEDKNSDLAWEIDATKSGLLTYAKAREYCQQFGEMFYGKAFDVPEVDEFKTILKNNQARIDTNIFKNLNETYWTKHDFAYSFYYDDGVLVDKEKGLAYVRCVGKIDKK